MAKPDMMKENTMFLNALMPDNFAFIAFPPKILFCLPILVKLNSNIPSAITTETASNLTSMVLYAKTKLDGIPKFARPAINTFEKAIRICIIDNVMMNAGSLNIAIDNPFKNDITIDTAMAVSNINTTLLVNMPTCPAMIVETATFAPNEISNIPKLNMNTAPVAMIEMMVTWLINIRKLKVETLNPLESIANNIMMNIKPAKGI